MLSSETTSKKANTKTKHGKQDDQGNNYSDRNYLSWLHIHNSQFNLIFLWLYLDSNFIKNERRLQQVTLTATVFHFLCFY